MSETRVDIAIVGGGLVGGTLAAALASTGAEIALIDRLTPTAQTDAAFDGRAAFLEAYQRVLARIESESYQNPERTLRSWFPSLPSLKARAGL